MVEDGSWIAFYRTRGGLVSGAEKLAGEGAVGNGAFKENSFVFLGESGIIILTVHPEIWV